MAQRRAQRLAETIGIMSPGPGMLSYGLREADDVNKALDAFGDAYAKLAKKAGIKPKDSYQEILAEWQATHKAWLRMTREVVWED